MRLFLVSVPASPVAGYWCESLIIDRLTGIRGHLTPFSREGRPGLFAPHPKVCAAAVRGQADGSVPGSRI